MESINIDTKKLKEIIAEVDEIEYPITELSITLVDDYREGKNPDEQVKGIIIDTYNPACGESCNDYDAIYELTEDEIINIGEENWKKHHAYDCLIITDKDDNIIYFENNQ